MVRSRTNRIVMSQRDIRQTSQPDPSPQAVAQFPSSIFCTWCREDGRHFACLSEWTQQPPTPDPDSSDAVHDWTKTSEGWVPVSGPCCEDCLELAFDRRNKAELGGGGRGKELMDDAHNWCRERGRHVRNSLQQGWNHLCQWLERTKEQLKQAHRENQAERWRDVQFEAEGFLEVKIVVSRDSAIQHLEVDFPTDIPVAMLKGELATVIDVPAEGQLWFYQGQRMDETKTLEQLKVDIGAVLEVKCHNL